MIPVIRSDFERDMLLMLAKCYGTYFPQGECLDCALSADCEEVTEITREAELRFRDDLELKEGSHGYAHI